MCHRKRSGMGAGRSWFSQRHGAKKRPSPVRRLLWEGGLEPRLLLAAEERLAGEVLSVGQTSAPVLAENVFAAYSTPAWSLEDASGAAAAATNQILVKLREQTAPALSPLALRGPATALVPAHAYYPLSEVLLTVGAESAEPVMPRLARIPAETGRWPAVSSGEAEAPPESSEAAARAALGRWFRLELPVGADAQAAIFALGSMAEVEAAETNIAWGLTNEIPPVIDGLPDATTDPAYDDQWHHGKAWTWKAWDYLNHNGIYPGGTQDVVVAVIDSGVDYNHEELKANMWVNPGEIPGNGIDDDGNGFIDDIHGASVVSNPNLHSGNPIDYHGHGTHVAGIIAAQGFNGKGGVGVAFNTRIMAIRAAQYSGVLTVDDIAEGILYAVDNGAEVINMSFGGYQRSQIIEDALEVALNQAVLVAAAGNDSMYFGNAPFYPAGLPYVLGVEASTPKGGLADFSNFGYDIKAPGVSIYSSLPGNQYAAWSGTSMAAPVVSGVAALMRSYFWQRDVYSSRFIMGSIAASGSVVDAYTALTEPPTPGVSLYSTWLFDNPAIDPGNDGDGRADAGETLHIGFELINRSGQADHVRAILDAYAPGASQPDPYVEILSNTVILQGIGPFATDDNGLIYDASGVITGVEAPWIVRVKPDAPNDHVINFVVTIYFEDGWNPNPEVVMYERMDSFQFIVQRGRNLPPVISEDMTLTADDFWIVGGPVLVEPGVTLTVGPGTQIQWGAISSDPYNPGPQTGYMIVRGALRVEGTQEAPVSLLPSYLVSGQTVDIRAESGDAQMSYVKVRNPKLTNLYSIDHGYLDWDLYTSTVEAWHIRNTTLHKFRGGGSLTANYQYDTVLFDAGWLPPSGGAKITNSVILQDNENNKPITYSPVLSYDETWYPSDGQTSVDKNLPIEHNGYTYALFYSGKNHFLQAAELAAEYLGGEVVSIPNQDEQTFLASYWSKWLQVDWGARQHQHSLMGLRPLGAAEFQWPDGSPVYFTNWVPSYPGAYKGAAHTEGVWFSCSGYYCTLGWYNQASGVGWYLIRIPGRWTKEEINAPFLDGRIDAYIDARLQGVNRGNAFLSKYWDPNISRWMRISSPGSSTPLTAQVMLEENYWGTTSTTLIDHAIIDYDDNFTTAHVNYGTPLEHGSETTFPFVESVLIDGVPAEQVPMIGAGPVSVTLHFNRDMDPSVQPFVAFGPATPFTDFRVHPVGGNTAGYNSNVFEFTVRLSQPSSRPVTVSYATQDGMAKAGIDYVATSGKLTFEAGETTKTVQVRILGDTALEPDQDFRLVLSEPTIATIADGLGVGTILDDELTLAIGDVTLWEGNAATSLAVFPVTLSAPSDQVVSVSYETVADTAVALDDYAFSRGTVTFQPGETEKTISVPVFGNSIHQPDRSFSVRLTHPRVANLAHALGVATIRDDDFLLSAEEVRVAEGDSGSSEAVFTVCLSGASDQTVTVDYATADGTATAGSDYQAASGTLSFAPGVLKQTIVVTVAGDPDVEPNETFVIQFSNASGASLVASEVSGSIVGDDGPLVSIADISYVEKDSSRADAIFTVTLSADPAEIVTVDYTTPGLGTATLAPIGMLGGDYHPASGTLTFAPGDALTKTIAVSVAGDTWAEDDEDFFVLLSSSDVAISDHLGGATIVNDDPYFEWDDVVILEDDAGTSQAEFILRLIDCPDGETVTVNYRTVDSTARAGEDYVAQSGTVTFAAGELRQQTISVPILGDTVDELDEDFQILLSAPSGAIIFDYVAQGTISNDDRPTLAIEDVAFQEGQTGVTEFSFPVRLSHPAADTVTVDWAASDATARAGEDYLAASGTLTFLPGEIEQSIVVEVLGDTLNELDESLTLTLNSPEYAAIADGEAMGTVLDDDNPLLTITDVSVLEGDDGTTVEAAFAVSLSEASPETVTIDFATAESTATAGTDYQTLSGTLTFLPGQIEQTIAVTVVGDDDPEVSETFVVVLSEPVNGVLGDAQGTGTIVGDDGPLLEILYSQLVEGDTGTIFMGFPVRLSAAADDDVQVSYATADGGARAGTDYGSTSGVLIFTAGQTEKTVLVPVLGDLQHESDETLFVRLSQATVAAIADAEALGTIVDDDPVLSVNDVTVTEGSGDQTAIEFTISLSRQPVPSKPVTVRYDTANGTAAAGGDYLQVGGTLTFTSDVADPLDKTVTVIVQGDITNEVDEDFFLTLSEASGAEIAVEQGQATILDDDGPKLLVSDATITEGDAGPASLDFTVSLSQASAVEVNVDYTTADGTAQAGLDYQATSGTLVFSPGELAQTISVPVIGDLVDEDDETLRLVLSGGSGIPIARASGLGTILDDDTATLSVDDVQQAEGFNGWSNSRTWQGVFWVTPMTGESYHQMRISGAAAADDPWLVSGYDVGRFRFQIKTMGVSAMTLQAMGQEGSIRLSWAQDDFELLGGYNVYRATSEGGTYTRLNSSIIPVGQESFLDTNVSPAVPMYYKFTVVQTDMTESAPSNVASAAALDTILPVIVHTPKTSAVPGAGLRLTATVTDNVAVEGVAVHYRPLGSTQAYVSLPMTNLPGTSWSVTIPGTAVQPPGVEYYLTARDELNTIYHGNAAAPHSVLVTAAPSLTSVSPNEGSSDGGLRVTLSGAQFQAGATVLFGDVPATDIVVQTSGQILCTTPPHFPALVDVQVVNPDASQATLLSGFRYVDDDAVLSLPTLSADRGAILEIPISLAQVDGLRAAQLTVNFDAAVLKILGASTGTLTSGWALEHNKATAGRVVLTLAGVTPSSGNGTLAKLNVEVVGAIASQTVLSFSNVLLNDGAIEANLSNGSFAVNGFFSLGGSVKYCKDNRPVPGTALELVGVGAQSAASDAGGGYTFATVQTGAYTLTPAKADQVSDITAYDASLILQTVAGSRTLTTNQRLAADVNRDGAVTAMDAAYVLEKAVDLLPGHFPGAGRSWLFSPAERTYPLLNGNLAGQDFTAILIGDVSGNWDGLAGGGGEPEGAAGWAMLGETSVTLTLPDVIWPGGQTVDVPLQIVRGAADVYSLDLKLAYDASQLLLVDVTAGDPADGAMLFANTAQPGFVRIAMASGSPLSQDGELLTLSFQVTGNLATPAAVSWQSASVDEGAVISVVDSGFVADQTPPAVSVEPRWTNQVSPPLSGTVDDTLAAVSVSVAGRTYAADNRGDGTWFLAANTIAPALADGAYDVQVQAWDVLSRCGEDATLDELTIDTLPPQRSGLTPTADTRGVPFDPELQIAFAEPVQKGAGTIVLKRAGDGTVVETIEVAGSAVSVSGTTARIQPSSTLLDSTAYRVEVPAGAFTDRAGNQAAAIDGASEWTFTTRGALVVESFQATGTGFVATFTSDLRSETLNLYDQGGVWGTADVRVVGDATGPVRGSLVVGPGLRQVTFVATSGVLPPDQYRVTFVSGTDSLHDVNAKLLDGDADGAVGDDFATVLSIESPSAEAVVIGLPHVTRGYGQPVNLPAHQLDAGLPLTISDGVNVSQVTFQLHYDPALLEITDFAVNTALAGGNATASLTFPVTGVASLSITAPASFAAQPGPLTIGSFTVVVPVDAPYGAKHILDISNLQVLDAATPPAERPSIDRDALHVAAFVGDTNGDGWYNSPDATLTRRILGQMNTGFGAYALADPVLFADVTHNGIIQANDTTAIRRAIGQIAVPDIPPLPEGLSFPAASGPDPRIYLPRDLAGAPGETVTVPVMIEVTEPAGVTIGGLDLLIEFDPARFTVSQARLGGLLQGTDLAGSLTQPSPGKLIYTADSLVGTPRLPLGTQGELLRLTVAIAADAAPGPARWNLLASLGAGRTGIFDGSLQELVLSPPPTNAADDAVDGLLIVNDGSPPWHNPANGRDVNDDDLVTALDALIVINRLNAEAAGDTSPPVRYYYDVNDDSQCTPLDVLMVINQLNAEASSAPAGERAAAVPPPFAEQAVDMGNAASAGAKAWLFERAEFDLLPLDTVLGDLADDIASAWGLR